MPNSRELTNIVILSMSSVFDTQHKLLCLLTAAPNADHILVNNADCLKLVLACRLCTVAAVVMK